MQRRRVLWKSTARLVHGHKDEVADTRRCTHTGAWGHALRTLLRQQQRQQCSCGRDDKHPRPRILRSHTGTRVHKHTGEGETDGPPHTHKGKRVLQSTHPQWRCQWESQPGARSGRWAGTAHSQPSQAEHPRGPAAPQRSHRCLRVYTTHHITSQNINTHPGIKFHQSLRGRVRRRDQWSPSYLCLPHDATQRTHTNKAQRSAGLGHEEGETPPALE